MVLDPVDRFVSQGRRPGHVDHLQVENNRFSGQGVVVINGKGAAFHGDDLPLHAVRHEVGPDFRLQGRGDLVPLHPHLGNADPLLEARPVFGEKFQGRLLLADLGHPRLEIGDKVNLLADNGK